MHRYKKVAYSLQVSNRGWQSGSALRLKFAQRLKFKTEDLEGYLKSRKRERERKRDRDRELEGDKARKNRERERGSKKTIILTFLHSLIFLTSRLTWMDRRLLAWKYFSLALQKQAD